MRIAEKNLKQHTWCLLALFFAFLGGSTAIFSEGDANSSNTKKIAPTKIYYVTWQIDRAAGPFVRQVKSRLANVGSPHNNPRFYAGRQWEEIVDIFLTKKDSQSKQPFPVIVPLPAACFDKLISPEKKQSCLSDPASFAEGFFELLPHEIRSYKSLSDVFGESGIAASELGHRFYNQERWLGVVRNLNPNLGSSDILRPGTVFVLPILRESASSDAKSGN